MEAGWDDSVRLYEGNRVVIFDADLKPVRTRAEHAWVGGIRVTITQPDGSYLALSDEPLRGRPLIPIYRRSADGTRWARIPDPDLEVEGPFRVIARTRAAASQLWVVQFAMGRGRGYDLLKQDPSGRVTLALQRRPRWWRSEKGVFPMPSRSNVVFSVREIADGLVAVLMRHPLPNFADIPIDPTNGNGSWRRFETILEIIDVNKRTVVSSARLRGFSRFIIDDRHIATWKEEEDGTPIAEIYRFDVRR